jgi:hypothetical protein
MCLKMQRLNGMKGKTYRKIPMSVGPFPNILRIDEGIKYCRYCKLTEKDKVLLGIRFKGKESYVCPECFFKYLG